MPDVFGNPVGMVWLRLRQNRGGSGEYGVWREAGPAEANDRLRRLVPRNQLVGMQRPVSTPFTFVFSWISLLVSGNFVGRPAP